MKIAKLPLPSQITVLLSFWCATACAVELPRAGSDCNEIAETERWVSAAPPDVGAQPPLLSAHRGGTTLAPENTLWAYRHAFAYDMDFVEIDVRETLDGVFVSMHDDTVDRTTNGTGQVSQMSWAQLEQLNAADFFPWRGSQYDPSGVPRLEQILQLARDARKGIEFDIKAVRNYTQFFDMVAAHGLMSRSYFSISGDQVGAAQAYNPEIRVIFNIEGNESPEALYAETRRTAVYGSRRDKFTPEKIAAVHDGCAFVLPHSYDAGPLAEGDEFRRAQASGADGAQVDQPDLIAHVAERRVAAVLIHRPDTRQVCLLNSDNGLGIPRRLLSVWRIIELPDLRLTDRDGCISFARSRGRYLIRHEGSPAVREATLTVSLPGS